MFWDKIFGDNKVDKVIYDELKSALSFEYAQVDRPLLRALLSAGLGNKAIAYLTKNMSLTATGLISLKDEFENLTAFVGLCRLVWPDSVFVKIENKGFDEDLQLFPFSLLPLVQNAVYNGYLGMVNFPIRIRVQSIANVLKFEVSNRVNHHLEDQAKTDYIDYVKNRLGLLYEGRHDLLLNSNTRVFKATLTITL